MGYSPTAPPKPPTYESFHLGYARRAYVEGAIDAERFETIVGEILAGTWSGQVGGGFPPSPRRPILAPSR